MMPTSCHKEKKNCQVGVPRILQEQFTSCKPNIKWVLWLEFFWWRFIPQEWSISNFPCSLIRNITLHSRENLAFYSLLRWKMIILLILTTFRIHVSLKSLEECTFWTWEWKVETWHDDHNTLSPSCTDLSQTSTTTKLLQALWRSVAVSCTGATWWVWNGQDLEQEMHRNMFSPKDWETKDKDPQITQASRKVSGNVQTIREFQRNWSLPKRAGTWVRISTANRKEAWDRLEGQFERGQANMPHHYNCCVPGCTNNHNCSDAAFLLGIFACPVPANDPKCLRGTDSDPVSHSFW